MSGSKGKKDQTLADNDIELSIMSELPSRSQTRREIPGGGAASQAQKESSEEKTDSSKKEPVIMESPKEEEYAAEQEPAIMEGGEELELLHPAGPSTRPDSPDSEIHSVQESSSSQSSSLISVRYRGDTVGQRIWDVWESGLHRVGLNPCLLHRCMPFNIVCTTCEDKRLTEKRIAAAKKFKEQGGPADLAAQAAEGHTDSININIYLSRSIGLELVQFYPLTINREMTVYQVIKALGGATSTEDFFKYSLVENWKDYGAHRFLDDCEMIYINEWEHVASRQNFYYSFQKNEEKFDYTRKNKRYFITPEEARMKFSTSSNTDPDLIQIRHRFFLDPQSSICSPGKAAKKRKGIKSLLSRGRSTRSDSEKRSPGSASKALVHREESRSGDLKLEISEAEQANPIYCSTVYVRGAKPDSTVEELRLAQTCEDSIWLKKYLLLRDKTLYFVKDHSHMMKYYLMENDEFEHTARKKLSKRESRTLQILGYTCQLDAYRGVSARDFYNSPFGGCIYLRRFVGAEQHPLLIMFCPKALRADPTILSDAPEMSQKLWLTAIQIAKHGPKIAGDFLMYRTDMMMYNVKLSYSDDMAAKVPMDFSSGVGKLVPLDEPQEDETTKKVLRFEPYEQIPREAFANGVHLTQQYYHRNLSRDAAQAKLQAAGTNGSWLLRNSSSRENTLIISYIFEGRFFHKYVSVVPYVDQSSESRRDRIYVATLDHILAFYDIHSLLDFYRLNHRDELLCRLGTSVKNPNQPNRSPERSRVRAGRQMLLTAAQQTLAGQVSEEQSASSVEPRVPPAEVAGPSSGGSTDVASAPEEKASSSEELSTEAAAESLSSDPSEKPMPGAN